MKIGLTFHELGNLYKAGGCHRSGEVNVKWVLMITDDKIYN